MKKEHLVPLEKSKRIIYLDRRGKEEKRLGSFSLFLGVTGLVCLLYCLSIWLFMGYGSSFFLVWAAGGVALCGLAWLFAHKEWLARLPKWLKRSFWVCVIIGGSLFIIVEGMIFSQFGAKAEPGADYVIVLGAQWKANGPSYVVQKRLDKAIAYLNANPATQVIVSGGKGTNEHVSEAQGMQGYLVTAGIAPERILMEDKSTNTHENLVFSSMLLHEESDRVVLVTNNFHVFRATAIARKQGYAQVEGLAAGSYPGMLPNNLLREFVGVMKDFLMGNM